jgi:Ca2+/Na+ antiporter
MIAEIRRHEGKVAAALEGTMDGRSLDDLLAFHETWIRRLQHERLAHLVTMLAVSLFFLLSLAWALTHFSWAAAALAGLLLILSAAYIFHYFRLENAVQRWYAISDRIRERQQAWSSKERHP